MKYTMVISATGHLALLVALWLSGQWFKPPAPHRYPTTITATLVQHPAVARIKPAAEKPVQKREEAVATKPNPKARPPKKATPKTTPADVKPSLPPRTPAPATTDAPMAGNALKIDAPDFPFPHYLALVQYRIEVQWQPPATGSGSRLATIHFIIAADGQVKAAKVEKTSGNFAFDQAALRAVLRANPLPPLPSGAELQSLGVHFDFYAE